MMIMIAMIMAMMVMMLCTYNRSFQERDQLTLALEAKKSLEAKLTLVETKLMSANEEVRIWTILLAMIMVIILWPS